MKQQFFNKAKWKEINITMLYKDKYSLDAIKGMMNDGIDRQDAMRKLTEALGGRLVAFMVW